MQKRASLIRKADPFERPLHLVEELAIPLASVTSRRIVLWVYRDGRTISEIVLTGHAEMRTCSMATTAITQALKQVGPEVWWFMTCGAAHIKVGEATPANQRVLGEMVSEFHKMEEERGLVLVNEYPSIGLDSLRGRWRAAADLAEPIIVLPDPKCPHTCADFLPILMRGSPDQPLVFHLNGWDFDDPSYQGVADMHLRHLMRETLSDAMRRRRIYRSWLRQWLDDVAEESIGWITRLHALSNAEAHRIQLAVPTLSSGPDGSVITTEETVDVEAFLRRHLQRFLGDDARTGSALADRYRTIPFGRLDPEKLHERTIPKWVTEFDFERGTPFKRPGTEADAGSLFDQLTAGIPSLITEAMLYIARMDWHIRPYEDLRGVADRPGLDQDRARDMRFHDLLSRRIVLETMIRGWPSFYLERPEDQRLFERWAKERRPYIWKLMCAQAEAAGVSPQILLEDNVVYDVRFDDDMGCNVQPLMLVDDASHAQLHGSNVGASVSIPLWSRRTVRLMSGPEKTRDDNISLARDLVQRASDACTGPQPDIERAERELRAALAAHPARAARSIMDEWRRRLNVDPFFQLRRANVLLEAVELAKLFRFGEAQRAVETYLRDETHPPRDALALAGICEATGDSKALRELGDSQERHKHLSERFCEVRSKLAVLLQTAKSRQAAHLHLDLNLRNEIESLHAEAQKLEQRLEHFDKLIEAARSAQSDRVALIEKALADPESVRAKLPNLARAAEQAPDILRNALVGSKEAPLLRGLYAQGDSCSPEFIERYAGRYHRLVKLMGLFRAIQEVTQVRYAIGEEGAKARAAHSERIARLAEHPWLPRGLAEEIGLVATQFAKGDWDHMLTWKIDSFLETISRRCLDDMSVVVKAAGVREPALITFLAGVQLAVVMDNNYREVFHMLREVTLTLQDAAGAEVEIMDDGGYVSPSPAHLQWNRPQSVVSLVNADGCRPLLRFLNLQPSRSELISAALDGLDAAAIQRPGGSLAMAVLSIRVEPPDEWRAWVSVIERLEPEMIMVLSEFPRDACILPDYIVARTAEDQLKLDREFQEPPRDWPQVDWAWHDLGAWNSLIPEKVQRATIRRVDE